MYSIFVKCLVLAALIQLGIESFDFFDTDSGKASKKSSLILRKIIKFEWRPVSVFPNEAKRFQ